MTAELVEYRPTPTGGVARRCTATSKRTGQQCGDVAVRGLDKCRMHVGMSLAEARAEAARRAASLVHPAFERVADTIADENAPQAVRLAAAKMVVDLVTDPKLDQPEELRVVRLVVAAFHRAVAKVDLTEQQRSALVEAMAGELPDDLV